jgi:hypothetical protein
MSDSHITERLAECIAAISRPAATQTLAAYFYLPTHNRKYGITRSSRDQTVRLIILKWTPEIGPKVKV